MGAESKREPEVSTPAPQQNHSFPGDKLLEKFLTSAKPIMNQVLKAVDQATPVIKKGVAKANDLIKPIGQPEEVFPILVGLVLMTAGGLFTTLVLVVEALRTGGTWKNLRSSFHSLSTNYKAAKAASGKDTEVTKTPTVMGDLLKSASEAQLWTACESLASAIIIVVATLRIPLVCSMTLASSLADMAEVLIPQSVIHKYAENIPASVLPNEARHLVPWFARASFLCTGFFFAAYSPTYALALYSALRGSQVFLGHLLPLLVKKQKIAAGSFVDTHRDALTRAVGVGFFVFHMWAGFYFTLLLKTVFLPVYVLDSIAYYALNLVV